MFSWPRANQIALFYAFEVNLRKQSNNQNGGSVKLTFTELGIAAVATLIGLHVNAIRNMLLVTTCNTCFILFVLMKETKVFVTSGVQFSLLFSKTNC